MKNQLHHCDIILYVCSSFTNLNECIQSIFNNTCDHSYTLHIIDKSCDKQTKVYLDNCSRQNSQVIIHQSGKDSGIIENFNRCILQGKAPYVLLINSDVMVTNSWLDRMLSCVESDPMIGSVSPFTNSALDININMPSGSNFVSMNSFLKKIPVDNYPDILTGDAFCTLFRRKFLDEIGCFDSSFHDEYYNRLDLSMRFLAKGYRIVLAPDVYIYCLKKNQIPVQNNAFSESQKKRFYQKWGKEYKKKIHFNLKTNSLEQHN